MQPAIPLWVTVALAFAAPVIAFVGVAMGAWMQRRTTRLQLEAARERDRELWAREDRHRFAEQKRLLYAEFLAVSARYYEKLLAAAREIEPARSKSKDPLTEQEHRNLVEYLGYPAILEQLSKELDGVQSSVELVSPLSVCKAVKKVNHSLLNGSIYITSWWDQEKSDSHLDKAMDERDELVEVMRSDLAASAE